MLGRRIGMNNKYSVRLTDDEREQLEEAVRSGTTPATRT